MSWIADRKLVRKALDIPFERWSDIEPLIIEAKGAHTKEVLRRLMTVKRNRTENHGN